MIKAFLDCVPSRHLGLFVKKFFAELTQSSFSIESLVRRKNEKNYFITFCFTLVAFAQDSLPATEAPVSDSVPSAAPATVTQEAAQTNAPQAKSSERPPASTKKNIAQKIVKKKLRKRKS